MSGMRSLMALLSAITAPGMANAAEPFYAGKTITFIEAQAPGGGSDVDCQLFAQYMPKYIPGNPTLIIEHKPSNDSVVALNYVGKIAKKDGLTLFCGVYGLNNGLIRPQALDVDLNDFNYVMGDGDSNVLYVRSDVPPGIKSPEDVFKAEGLILGGFAVDGVKDLGERLALEVLGIDHYKYVAGFTGSGATRAAIQQKFINIFQEASSGYNQVTVPTLVKTGEVVPLFNSGTPDRQGNMVRDSRMPDMPTLAEFYRSHFGKPPSGLAWELTSLIYAANGVGLYAVMLPPGSPPDALAAMRSAVAPLNQDPDFVAASDKARGTGMRETPGALVLSKVSAFFDMRSELKQKYLDTIKSGQEMAQKAH